MKTKQETDDLIADWRSDRSYDIEDAEGFEDHREELLAVRREVEAKEDARAAKQREADIARLMEPAIAILPRSPVLSASLDDATRERLAEAVGPTQEMARAAGSTVNIILRMVAEMLLPLEQALARQAEDIERLQERSQ